MIIDTLVTDRTQADVDRVNTLTGKWLAGTITNAEKEEWLAGMKGAYNYTDLNRVGNAVAFIAGVLESAGTRVTVTAKNDWTMEDIPTTAQAQALLTDLTLLKGSVRQPVPDVPVSMDNLTVETANRIEEILVSVYNAINYEGANWERCGIAVCGVEGGL